MRARTGGGGPRLRPYQSEPLRAIVRSVRQGLGLTFTVLMSRQAGKNELSAYLEMLLLARSAVRGGTIVKCAPTFRPQVLNSLDRLARRLDAAGFGSYWRREHGYGIRLGNARALFFSAAPGAQVVGQTADCLLEVDEAQDVDPVKYAKDFRPMGATANVTTVLYGTPWDDSTLLAQTIAENRALEARDGIRRHFAYDWQTVAAHVPAYAAFVAAERERLGDEHPVFQTQYALRSLAGQTGLFSAAQQALLAGDHDRRREPLPDRVYVAGLDLAGGTPLPAGPARSGGATGNTAGPMAEEDGGKARTLPIRDSSVLTIAELDFSVCDEVLREPAIRIVDHLAMTGVGHREQYARLLALAGRWGLRRLVVDATGLGQPVAAFLAGRLGGRVEPFVFTAASKSRLAFDLIAALNAGRVHLYRDDGSAEWREFRQQIALARGETRPNQTLNFFVDARAGHDDYLMSLALAVRATGSYRPRVARGRGVF